MAKPAQMFDSELNGTKGLYPAMPWVVDKAVDLDSTIMDSPTNLAKVKAGRVVTIDPTSKRFILGLGTITTTKHPMPFVLFQNGSDFDVVGDDGNMVGAAPQGVLRGRPMGIATCTSAEVETTEYVAATYVPGEMLISDSDGKWTKYVSGASTICGVVSDGPNSDGTVNSPHDSSKKLLRLFLAYVPINA